MVARQLHQRPRVGAVPRGRPRQQLGGLVRAAPDEDSAPDRHADGDPDLAEGVVDSRRHPASLLWHDAQGDVRHHRVQEPDPGAEEEHSAQEARPAVGGIDPGHQQEAEARDGQGAAHHHPRRQPRQQRAGEWGREEADHGERQVTKPGAERREPEVVLHVQRDVEEQRERRSRDRERGELHTGERRPLEQRQRQHRLLNAPFDHRERREQRGRAGEQRHDQRAPPTLVVPAHESEDEQEQRRAERHDAGPVDAGRVRVAALAQLQIRDRDREDPDRDVQVEDRLPSERVGQGAAHQRADGDRDADRGAVDPHGGAALAAGRELLSDQRQRDREHRRAADALKRARDVEERRVGGEGAEQ